MRRVVLAALLVLAVAGATVLMASVLLPDPLWRLYLQLAALAAALGSGAACGTLAWRWWSGRLPEDQGSHC